MKDLIGDIKKELNMIFKLNVQVTNCFIGRSGLGVGKISKDAIGVGIIIGTGCGAAVRSINKFSPAQGVAPAGRHTTLHENGRDCYCGKRLC